MHSPQGVTAQRASDGFKRKPTGYKRPGAVQSKVSTVTAQERRSLTEKLITKVHGIDLSPLEVMLDTMKMFYDDSKAALALHDIEKNREKKEMLKAMAKAEALNACSVAKDVAPYIHAKLQTTTIKGDEKNPLEVALGLTDSESLRAAVRGELEKQIEHTIVLDIQKEAIEQMKLDS